MIKKYSLIFLIFASASLSCFAQSVGDIAFLQYNGDGGGTTVKFLVLNDIPNGVEIKFTDNGWTAAGAFRGTTEGILTWTSPGVFCGDVISFIETPMILSTGGDQILAYTGTEASPTFIAAIQMNNGGWDADAISANTSAIPTGLTNGTNCLAISPEIDNAMYSGTLTGTRAVLLAAINDQTNWTTNNSTPQDFTGTFTISDCPTPICSLSASGYANAACNDNGTPSNNTDDFITFDLDPSGSVLGLTYTVTVSSGTITPVTPQSYGSPITFTLQNGSAGAGDVTVTIQDIIGPACTLDQVITDPGSCNAICNIASSGFSTQLCNDNGTSADDTDDYISFVLNPTGSTLASTYSVSVSSGSITPNSGINYGGPIAFTLQNGSAGAGNVTVTIIDDVDGACTFAVPITDNGDCSSTNCATELFFSEYGEGSGSNKYLEIYNGTGANVDLGDYQLWKINNGGAWSEATVNLTGTLADGDVYVVANSLADATILAQTDNTGVNSITNFNGDDAVGLAKDDGSGTFILIDAIGEATVNDPGSGWDVAGILNGTLNHTLVRKTSVIAPTTNWAASAGTTAANSQWIVYNMDDWTYLGDHDDCTVTCTPVHSITSFDPASGPIGTEVTIVGDDFSMASIVSFNGVSSSDHTYIDSDNDTVIDTIIAVVPSGATTGVITVTESTCDLDTATDFTVLETIGSCSGGYSDLMLTEVYDAQSGSLGYLEVYNGTGGTLNLSDYSIRRYGDATDLAGGEYTLYNFPSTHTTIANGITYFGKVFSGSDPGGPATPDFTFDVDCSNTFTFCGGFNVDDIFHLYYFDGTTDTLIDAYVATIGSTGFSALRDINTAGPNNSSNPSDWNISGSESIGDLGNFISTPPGNSPAATAPVDVTGACSNTAVFSTTGSPGSGGTLTYVWYYYDTTASSWLLVNGTNLPLITTITGENTNTLNLDGGLASYNGYQFYCLVTENGTCSVISNASQIKIDSTVWNGSWSSAPTIGKIATINAPFNTATHGDFSACSLIVNATMTVGINDGGYIEIYNDLINNGTLNIDNNGSLVQIDDDGLNIGNISVQRMASIKNRDYVYWSSPVAGFQVNNISPTTPTNYLYKWDPTWTNPNGTEGYWLSANGDTMAVGVGYIVRAPNGHPAPAFLGDLNFTTAFNNGVPHNGEYIIPVSRGSTVGSEDDDWNLIGNPYPSSINAIDFLTDAQNTNIEGFIDVWTHGTAPGAFANPFFENYGLNYTDADYLTYNSSGSSNGAGTFNGFIAAGQGFMVNMVNGPMANLNVTFNNALRSTTNNSQFFKSTKEKKIQSKQDSVEKHRIWLDLLSPSYSLNRILVGYIEGATMGRDRMYDAKNKTLSSQNFYSLIDDESFIIQGRSVPFDQNDAIPIGMNIVENGSHMIAVGEVDGVFENGAQTIYLKDKVLDVIHNLSVLPYTFTVEEGEINDRFEIIFNRRLSTDDNIIGSNDLLILELQNGDVRFSVGQNHKIKSVEIIDILGRTLYRLKGDSNSEIYNLSNLSQATYIAKVQLFNGQVISKKAIKRN